jgi:hypothetical protein
MYIAGLMAVVGFFSSGHLLFSDGEKAIIDNFTVATLLTAGVVLAVVAFFYMMSVSSPNSPAHRTMRLTPTISSPTETPSGIATLTPEG